MFYFDFSNKYLLANVQMFYCFKEYTEFVYLKIKIFTTNYFSYYIYLLYPIVKQSSKTNYENSPFLDNHFFNLRIPKNAIQSNKIKIFFTGN
ncbi:MAG: hypothetical protein DRQ01_01830 [Ignavibacteriae bacterium]|nr:MAG: hypothetical protein DRQ01_01830 [Ignavibacteriota bacterium]